VCVREGDHGFLSSRLTSYASLPVHLIRSGVYSLVLCERALVLCVHALVPCVRALVLCVHALGLCVRALVLCVHAVRT